MEKSSVIRSAGVVGLFTMLSRVLGLVRDVVMAGLFGLSAYSAAFFVAFTIPNLMRRLFGEGALSSAFIPVFVETRKKQGDALAWQFARRVITLTFLVLLIIAAAGILLCSLFIANPSWGYAIGSLVGKPDLGDMLLQVFPLLRIMFPYVLFICLVALAMGILNSFRHFAVPAATPCILNLVWILGMLVLVPLAGGGDASRIKMVAWVILGAGVLQLLVQFPVLIKHGYRPGFELPGGDPRVRRVMTLMGPAALGMAVTQFNVLIDRVLAMWVGPHAPGALFFSERLIYLPLGIFATAMGTVLLPVLSGHAVDEDDDRLLGTMMHSLRLLLFIMVPAAVGLLVLAHPVVQMIYEWKAFDPRATWFTGTALQFYAPGLVVFSLAKVFVPVFYSHQDTRTPVKIGVATVGLNFVLNLVFVITWPEEYKHAGLACATVLSEGVYAVTLGILIHRRFGSPGWPGALGSLLHALLLAALMAGTAWLTLAGLRGLVLHLGGFPAKATQVATVLGAVAAGLITYIAAAHLTGSREWRDVLNVLKRKRRQGTPA